MHRTISSERTARRRRCCSPEGAPSTPDESAARERITAQLQSAEGVRQGEPLAPLLFSVGIRALIEQLQRRWARITPSWRIWMKSLS